MLLIGHESLISLRVPTNFPSHFRVTGNVMMLSSRRFDCPGSETNKSQCAENLQRVHMLYKSEVKKESFLKNTPDVQV